MRQRSRHPSPSELDRSPREQAKPPKPAKCRQKPGNQSQLFGCWNERKTSSSNRASRDCLSRLSPPFLRLAQRKRAYEKPLDDDQKAQPHIDSPLRSQPRVRQFQPDLPLQHSSKRPLRWTDNSPSSEGKRGKITEPLHSNRRSVMNPHSARIKKDGFFLLLVV